MKYFLAFLIWSTHLSVMSQSFDREWAEVDDLMQKKLPKSAFEKANMIFEKSLATNNQEQIVKSIFYLQSLESQLEEIEYDSRAQKEIAYIERNLDKTANGAKSLVQSFLADKYRSFLDQNFYKISSRTQSTTASTEDISLWAPKDIEKRMQDLYLLSCSDLSNKSVDLSQFKSLIQNTESRYVRTLYDFLHHRAIEALSNERSFLQQSDESFVLNLEQIQNLERFVVQQIAIPDSNSNKHQVLLLFQKLIKAHIADSDPTILLDIELKRLQFLYNNYHESNRNKLFQTIYQRLFDKYQSSSDAYYCLIKIGQMLQGEGYEYSRSKDSLTQWKLKEAVKVYDQILLNCKNDDIVSEARNYRNNIIQQYELNPTVEKINVPQKPILLHLSYRNIDKVYYRIYPRTIQMNRQNNYHDRQEKVFKEIMKPKPVFSDSRSLKSDGDFQVHTTEFDLPPMKSGDYYIVLSRNEDFDFKNNRLSAVSFSLSNIAYFLETNATITNQKLIVVNRTTGSPIEHAQVEQYQRVWNNVEQIKRIQTLQTDQNGACKFKLEKNQRVNYFWVIKKGDDVLTELQESYFYHDGYQNQSNEQEQYQLFLDREIYRPGQTVFFKGIGIKQSNTSSPRVLQNVSGNISFIDVNGQQIDSKPFVTNQFGTFNGFFTAPKTGLLGAMHFQINGVHTKSVQIEEYKRPSFEIVFDTIQSAYKLNDTVSIAGTGMAFSGAKLPNASIKYRVLRRTNYPFWRCWWMPMPSEEKQVAMGETKTDDLGKFSITFKAKPGENSPWDQNPVFNYEIKVDMTDVTGEMQIGSTEIGLGKVDFQIQADVKTSYPVAEKIDIPISIQNLQGNIIQKAYEIKLEKLLSPSSFYQSRYWSIPDNPLMTSSEFKAKFPFFPYQNEDKIENYPISNVIQNAKFPMKLPQTGAYKLTISAKDKAGKTIAIERYFSVNSDKQLSMSEPFEFQNVKSTYSPESNLDFTIISHNKSQKIFTSIRRKNNTPVTNWSQASSDHLLSKIEESDRGGLLVCAVMVMNNRMYTKREEISVPWTNKMLDIEYIHFRDKLEPGQKEKWQIKIKGKQGEKVMAEVLANMYDQSLDQFAANNYAFFPYGSLIDHLSFSSQTFQALQADQVLDKIERERYHPFKGKDYPYLAWQENFYRGRAYFVDGIKSIGGANKMNAPVAMMAERSMEDVSVQTSGIAMKANANISTGKADSYVSSGLSSKNPHTDNPKKTPADKPLKVRTNLNETVFFKPDLKTDAEGNLIIEFTMNEALTKWKFMALAVTKDLQIGTTERSVVTQKSLMIQPNAPRYLREGDEVIMTARVTNMTDKKQSGSAFLELNNALSMKPVNADFGLGNSTVLYDIEAGQTKAVEWKLNVPKGISALQYRVMAKSGNYSDGEENTIPVLTNRMLVTETMPFQVKSNSSKSIEFKEMISKIGSPTLENKLFKIEYSSNPTWYAIQALPYLMEYPYECTEQLFNRYVANTLSSHILKQYPKIQSVFESWRGTDAMMSNLSKNQNLKSAILEETPWVLAAQSEEEQRRNISLLFDLNKIASEENAVIDKLSERQHSDGSFSWFPGGNPNEYITQYLIEGIGHLQNLGVKNDESNPKMAQILDRGIEFLDRNIVNHYEEMERMIKKYGGNINDDHLDAFALHYLYTRSFFDKPIPTKTSKIIQYYHNQGVKYWTKKSLHEEGLLALYFHRKKDNSVVNDMMKSFRERAKINEEKGMYWDMTSGYYWYQNAIETHCLMTEVFETISTNQTEKDNLKLWLLKNKQTNRWETTKQTAAAVFALLGGKNDKLQEPKFPEIKIGGKPMLYLATPQEQGTGYLQKSWTDTAVRPSLARVEIRNPNNNIGWGAVYWQYLENLDAIQKQTNTPLKVEKTIFVVKNSEQGEQMEIATNSNIKIGSRVRVRLTLKVEREMEFLHLKDMRASGFEPKDAVSGYKWPGGLGYYQTTRDASMNFFIDRIDKGTYTIEYDLLTNLKGVYSNGIATFQSMYAPEFNSHSEGTKLVIGE